MKGSARLFILVQDPEHNLIEEAQVSGRSLKGKFRRIPYDKRLQRYVLDGLEPGEFEIKASGPKDMTEEERTLSLTGGDNHVHVMLGRRGMLSFNSGGMNYYFTPQRDIVLLSVRRAREEKTVHELMKAAGLKYDVLTEGEGKYAKKVRPNDMLLVVHIGKDNVADRSYRALEKMLAEEFPRRGLIGRLAAPILKKGEPASGLTDEIIVRFRSSVTRDAVMKLAAEYKLSVDRNIPYLGNAFLLRRTGRVDYSILELVNALHKRPEVVYAEPNLIQRLRNAQYAPNDYLSAEVPHLSLINCDDAWQTLNGLPGGNPGGSPDVTIAILDLDGVDPTHPDLTGTLTDGTQKMVANFDFLNMSNQTFANLEGDHGTQCAGSATARMDNTIGAQGVAPNCHLIGGQMSAWASTLESADIWVWMAGFPTGSTDPNFPAQLTKGADIISNSWGNWWAIPTNQILRDVFDFLTTYGRGGRGCIVCFCTHNYGYFLVDNRNPYAADAKTLGIGASINTNPTNPCNSSQADHNGNTNNLPAVVDTRSYFSPYGMTVDIVSPSHTCYDPALPSVSIRDAIMAPVRVDTGDWPTRADSQTTLTQAAAQGDTVVQVASSAGFNIGEFALFNGPGTTPNETKEITAIAPGQITVQALENAYPVGTAVITGPNDYAMNPVVGFGGTSHSCPTVAGAAALLLSVVSDLTWIEVRDILRNTAVQIDPNQANNIGQWIDLDGDNVDDFSQWYGYGRLDVNAAVNAAINLTQRSDVVVRDNLNDNGSVPSPGWHASSPDIWSRQTNDPIPALAYTSAPLHQNPLFGQDNYVYVRIKNWGTGNASTVYVRALITHFPGIEFQYPEDWQPTPRFGTDPNLPLEPGTYLIGEEVVTNLAPGQDFIVKMKWEKDLVPPKTVTVNGNPVNWHPCLLAEASPHDGPPPVANAYPVKGNNNLAHRNISIDYPAGGSSSSFMSAAVAGSRCQKGVDALLIDRTRVPAEYTVILQAPDPQLMQYWIDIVKSGDGLKQVHPLGEPISPRDEKELETLLRHKQQCRVTLLDAARLAIRCNEDCVVIVHAPASTQLETICRSRGKSSGAVRIGQYAGRPALLIDHEAGAVGIPIRLACRQYVPVLVGITRPGGQTALRGSIRISQVRGDGEVSPGFEIAG